MSKLKEDTQAIADDLARDKYGVGFPELPKSTQDTLWKMAGELEQDIITAEKGEPKWVK